MDTAPEVRETPGGPHPSVRVPRGRLPDRRRGHRTGPAAARRRAGATALRVRATAVRPRRRGSRQPRRRTGVRHRHHHRRAWWATSWCRRTWSSGAACATSGRQPGEHPTDALASLRPAYRLLLEVIAARWQRRETAAAGRGGPHRQRVRAAAGLGTRARPRRRPDPPRRPTRRSPARPAGGATWTTANCPHTKRDKAAAAPGAAGRPASHRRAGSPIWTVSTPRCPTRWPSAPPTAPHPCTGADLTSGDRPGGAVRGVPARGRVRPAAGWSGCATPPRSATASAYRPRTRWREAWQRSRDGIAKRGGLARRADRRRLPVARPAQPVQRHRRGGTGARTRCWPTPRPRSTPQLDPAGTVSWPIAA